MIIHPYIVFPFNTHGFNSSTSYVSDAGRLDLMFAPESGNMLGGTIVNITGPCFAPKEKITCIFDIAPPVVGVVVNRNRAICVQPPLMAEGWVRFEIAVGNERFKWKGKYFVGECQHF